MSAPTIAGFDRERLDSLVAEGWLRCQRHPDADLWIYNYTEATQYANHWTPETLACRGLILGADGEIIARPFPKFFNYGTAQAVVPVGESFTVADKLDGSLGIAYQLDGEKCVATRGSFTSDQAKVGTQMLRDAGCFWSPGSTPLFEIVYPENRIVVDYGDRRELVLLGCIDNATGRDAGYVPVWGGAVAKRIDADDLASLAEHERPNAEGYVVTFESGARIKFKHDEYVRLHRIVTGVNARNVWESLKEGDDMAGLLEGVPDEIHEWIRDVQGGLVMDYAEIERTALDVFTARPDTTDRKTLAQYFVASRANAAVLFRMLDGQPYDDLIWKAIKPEAFTPDTSSPTPTETTP